MQVLIASTSSRIDDMILIETSTTIGDSVSTQRVGYTVDDLMENRYLAGTLEERTEALRQSAENMTETSVRLHFQALAKIAAPVPEITEVFIPSVGVNLEAIAEVVEKTAKKPRAKRQPKATV